MRPSFSSSTIGRTILVLSIFGLVFALVNITGVMAQGTQSNFDVLFTMPISPKGVQYAPTGDGSQQWGPKALAIAPDGTFFISNTVSNNILHIDATGQLLNTFNLTGLAHAVTDLKATPQELIALDSASYPQTILRLAYNGSLIASHELPVTEKYLLSATGLLVDETGTLFLEDRALIAMQLLDDQGNFASNKAAQPTLDGKSIAIEPATRTAPKTSSIIIGAQRFTVQTAGNSAGIRILSSSAQKTLYVLVSESVVDSQGTFWVDDVIHRYTADGQLLGISRFPLREQFTYVDHPITISQEGEVYGLLTRPDSIAIVRFRFSTQLPSVLPPQGVSAIEPQQRTSIGITACHIYRSYISENANRYLSNARNLTAQNIDGACAGRGKPRYLGAPGTYGSVPYDWGGWDTVAGFNSQMNLGRQAGDIDVSSVESCSRGVDCSGYVTRAWGLTDFKRSTCSLPDISTPLPDIWSLKEGDIMNWCGYHVTLIRAIDANGATIYESTMSDSLDRVVYRWVPWSYHSGYSPRKYNNLCDP